MKWQIGGVAHAINQALLKKKTLTQPSPVQTTEG
jgi:hypothetical protein